MLKFFTRYNKKKRETFSKEVRDVLKDHDFDPAWLDEMLSHSKDVKVDRMFLMLMKRRLTPEEAAKAIEVGTHFYNKKREEAQEKNWPLQYTDMVPKEYTREECFYLEQLVDSSAAVKEKRKEV